ncbi:MAG: DUF655 domain-containing protein [Nanoarchaeota archaeon]
MNSSRDKMGQKKSSVKEDYAIVLDTVDHKTSFKDKKIVQAVGYNTYLLFELVPKLDVDLVSGDKVYIGDGKREKIQYIKRILSPDDLSSSALSELIYVLIDIINDREKEFVNLFNSAGPISLRRHSLEIIPGVGKKHLKTLLDMREQEIFKSFEDIKQKCSFLPNPQKAIAERILDELNGKTDQKFFVKR